MDAPQDVASAAEVAAVTPDVTGMYLRHREAMYRVAYTMLRTDRHHRAEDVISDVMVSILKNPPGSVRNWEAYLISAVQNKVRDLWKSSASRHEQLVLAESRPLDGDLHGGDEVGEDAASAVVDMIRRQQTVRTVQEAMAEMEAWDSQAAYVLWQCAGLERTSQQVADELGVSSSRVRQIVMKAKKKLNTILEGKEVDL